MLITISLYLLCLPAQIQEPPASERTVSEWNQLGIEKLDEQAWDESISAFQKAAKLSPKDPQLQINLARAFTSRGHFAQQHGRLPVALDDYLTAEKTHRDGGSAEALRARLLLRLGQRAEAFELCQLLRKDFPENSDGWLVAAEIFRLRAEPQLGLELLQSVEVQEHSPNIKSRTWQAALKNLHAEAKNFAQYQKIISSHFVVLFDANNQHALNFAPLVSSELEAACVELSSRFGIIPAETLTAVVSGREKMGADAPAWSAALFDGRIRLAVGPSPQLESLRSTLRHEYMHALLHDLGAEIPTWFHEGLAQLAENPQFAPVPLPEFSGGLDALGGNWLAWTDETKVRSAYSYTLAFTRWLAEENGQTLWSLLFPQIQAWGFDEGFKKVLGNSAKELDQQFQKNNSVINSF